MAERAGDKDAKKGKNLHVKNSGIGSSFVLQSPILNFQAATNIVVTSLLEFILNHKTTLENQLLIARRSNLIICFL